MSSDTKSTTVVITGANRGIGLALCKNYLANGHHIIAVCRSSSAELDALSVEKIESVDVSKQESIEHLQQSIGGRQIDILINNAGILKNQTFSSMAYEEILEQFEVNSLGPIRVVEALYSSLKSESKIAMITSRMGSIEDNSSGSSYGYRMSKCALNAASKSMAIDFKPKRIAVGIIHPGYVQTQMVNFGGEISADLSAQRIIQRIEELNLHNSGTFWHSNGEVLPW